MNSTHESIIALRGTQSSPHTGAPVKPSQISIRKWSWVLLLTLPLLIAEPTSIARAVESGAVSSRDRTTQDDTDNPADVVAKLIIAFNDHSAEAMSGLVTDEFEIYYVGEDGKSALGLSGAESLKTEMERYFEALPDVQTTSEESFATGRFLAFRERVTWTQGDQKRTQSALAVYELKDRKIHRVWYYPAQP